MVAAKGDIYYGLWYPIVVALITVVVGALFLRDSRQISLEPSDTWRGAPRERDRCGICRSALDAVSLDFATNYSANVRPTIGNNSKGRNERGGGSR
jgi:hypothetical protein